MVVVFECFHFFLLQVMAIPEKYASKDPRRMGPMSRSISGWETGTKGTVRMVSISRIRRLACHRSKSKQGIMVQTETVRKALTGHVFNDN